jgi:hypothetical protein
MPFAAANRRRYPTGCEAAFAALRSVPIHEASRSETKPVASPAASPVRVVASPSNKERWGAPLPVFAAWPGRSRTCDGRFQNRCSFQFELLGLRSATFRCRSRDARGRMRMQARRAAGRCRSRLVVLWLWRARCAHDDYVTSFRERKSRVKTKTPRSLRLRGGGDCV